MADVPVVERHTEDWLAQNFTRGIEAWQSYPTPEGYEKTEPSKEENTPIHINGVEARNGASFVVDWIDHWGPP